MSLESLYPTLADGEVVGLTAEGILVHFSADARDVFPNPLGATVETFGPSNLTPAERKRVGLSIH